MEIQPPIHRGHKRQLLTAHAPGFAVFFPLRQPLSHPPARMVGMNAARYFMRREDYQPPTTNANSPFRRFSGVALGIPCRAGWPYASTLGEGGCLKCGSVIQPYPLNFSTAAERIPSPSGRGQGEGERVLFPTSLLSAHKNSTRQVRARSFGDVPPARQHRRDAPYGYLFE